jgi:hypothetical protein
MKKLIIIVFALFTLSAFAVDTAKTVVSAKDVPIAVAKDTTVTDVQIPTEVKEATWTQVWDAVLLVIDNIQWLFLVLFISIIGIMEMYIRATNKAPWLSWLNKVPIGLWVFILGVIFGGFYWWVFGLHTKQEFFWLLITLCFTMGVYKIGIDKLFKLIGQKLGFSYLITKPTTLAGSQTINTPPPANNGNQG